MGIAGLRISIPLWCDCDLRDGFFLISATTGLFQSHYGAIATQDDKGDYRERAAHISIPLWCDCDANEGVIAMKVSCEFQSHYGAIATIEFVKGVGGYVIFQSHYGAIATGIGCI